MAGIMFPALNATLRVCGRPGNITNFRQCCTGNITTIELPSRATASYCTSDQDLSYFYNCLRTNNNTDTISAFCQEPQRAQAPSGSGDNVTDTNPPSAASIVRPKSLGSFYALCIALLMMTHLPIFAFAAQCTTFDYTNAYIRAPNAMRVTPTSNCAAICNFSVNMTAYFPPYTSPTNITNFDIYTLAAKSVPDSDRDLVVGYGVVNPDHGMVTLDASTQFMGGRDHYMSFAAHYICVNGTVGGCDGDAGVVNGTVMEVCTLDRRNALDDDKSRRAAFGTYIITEIAR